MLYYTLCGFQKDATMTRKRFVKLLMSYNYSRNEAYQTAYILVDEDVGFKSYLEAYNYLLQKNLN